MLSFFESLLEMPYKVISLSYVFLFLILAFPNGVKVHVVLIFSFLPVMIC